MTREQFKECVQGLGFLNTKNILPIEDIWHRFLLGNIQRKEVV